MQIILMMYGRKSNIKNVKTFASGWMIIEPDVDTE